MLVLGITGGIGSGKSFVCRLLQRMSIPVYDCDTQAKTLYDSCPSLKQAMIARFGSALYDTPEGTLNRPLLAGLIFSNPKLLTEVNALVHPRVRADFDTWLEQHRADGASMVVIESAILMTSPELLSRVDCTLGILAPRELRLERAVCRDNLPREVLERRMAIQISDEELERQCSFTLRNDGLTPILSPLVEILQSLH